MNVKKKTKNQWTALIIHLGAIRVRKR